MGGQGGDSPNFAADDLEDFCDYDDDAAVAAMMVVAADKCSTNLSCLDVLSTISQQQQMLSTASTLLCSPPPLHAALLQAALLTPVK